MCAHERHQPCGWLRHAEQLSAAGRFADARSAYRLAIEHDPAPAVRLRFGCFLAAHDALEDASAVFSSLLHESPDAAVRSAAWHNLAAIARDEGRWDEAAARQQCAAGMELGDGRNFSRALQPADLSGLALDALARGELALAEELLGRSLRVEIARSSIGGQASDWGNLGIVRWLRGDLPDAGQCLAKALHLHRRLLDHRGIGTDLVNLSQICADAGGWQQSAELLERAVEHLRRAEAPRLLAKAERLLAEARRIADVSRRDPQRN